MQLKFTSPTLRLLGAGALVGGFLLASSAGEAQDGGPFAGLNGRWSGGGTIALKSGSRERIRCRATYSVSGGGNNLQQSISCASDSYRIDLNSSVSHQGGVITGTFSESSRGVGGRVSGRVSAGRINALAEGSGWSARLSVTTNGNQQSVTISSPGTEVSSVSISLRRG